LHTAPPRLRGAPASERLILTAAPLLLVGVGWIPLKTGLAFDTGNLFDKTPFAYGKAIEWSGRDETFVRRAGFVLMATLTVHGQTVPG